MADALKEVTVRVSIEAGEIPDLPDFAQEKGAASAYFATFESGVSETTDSIHELAVSFGTWNDDLSGTSAALSGVLGGLNDVSAAAGDLGASAGVADVLADSYAHLDEISQRLEASTEGASESLISMASSGGAIAGLSGDFTGLGDAVDTVDAGVGRLNNSVSAIGQIAQVNDSVASSYVSINDRLAEVAGVSDRAIASLSGVASELQGVSDASNGVTSAGSDLDGLADSSVHLGNTIQDVEQIIEDAANSVNNLAASSGAVDGLVSSFTTLDSVLDGVGPGVDDLGESIGAFGDDVDELEAKLRNAEDSIQFFSDTDLDAFNAALDESTGKAAANAAAATVMRENWLSGTAALGGAAAGLAQVAATVGVLTSSEDDVEEFARKFAKMQATISGLAAGASALQQLNEGLGKISKAATASAAANSVNATATGAAAAAQRGLAASSTAAAAGNIGVATTSTVAAGAMGLLATAATAAQRALGPLGLVLGGITLVVAGFSAVKEFFGEDLPEEIDESTDAVDSLTDAFVNQEAQIDRVIRKHEQNIAIIEQQRALEDDLAGGDVEIEKLERRIDENFRNTFKGGAAEFAKAIEEAEKLSKPAPHKQIDSLTKRRDAQQRFVDDNPTNKVAQASLEKLNQQLDKLIRSNQTVAGIRERVASLTNKRNEAALRATNLPNNPNAQRDLEKSDSELANAMDQLRKSQEAQLLQQLKKDGIDGPDTQAILKQLERLNPGSTKDIAKAIENRNDALIGVTIDSRSELSGRVQDATRAIERLDRGIGKNKRETAELDALEQRFDDFNKSDGGIQGLEKLLRKLDRSKNSDISDDDELASKALRDFLRQQQLLEADALRGLETKGGDVTRGDFVSAIGESRDTSPERAALLEELELFQKEKSEQKELMERITEFIAVLREEQREIQNTLKNVEQANRS